MGNRLLAKYYIFMNGAYHTIQIIGCYDKDTPAWEYDFYDVFDSDGTCLNEGMIFSGLPDYEQVKEYLTENFKKYQGV